MQPIPKLREKKACPKAASSVSPVILEKSGYRRNFTPSIAPSNVNDRIAKITTRMKSTGIRIFEYLSIPFLTPATTMRALSPRKRRCIITGTNDDSVNPENCEERELLSDVRNEEEKDLK